MVAKKYGVNELRRMYLDFFESKGHLVMKSFSLVPHNDNSLLLINAGMAPLKPYFTGQEIPPRRRVATCQKCIRTGDIENVGKTARHGTFFEMLGNFSFGDYFKHEAIAWTWEFLTEVVGLDPDRLYPSVYQDDDEAFDIWNKEIGIAKDRIFRFGKEDNFWEHGSGPCGPCSEVYYDRGEKYGCGKPTCTVGCDCDRYMEVWNNVFTQFDNDGHGNYTELKNKNIDTGMGLERLAVVVQDVDSIFEVDTIRSLLDHVARLAKTEYKQDHEKDISLRLITDHIRSCSFMISDGIMPSNEGRGYVLRRLLRRAARHGRKLGIQGTFLAKLAETVIESSKDGYPELEERRTMILKVLTTEEENFNRTIDQGLEILAELEDKLKAEGRTELSGEDAFRLYDTFGFPVDLTREILEEKGYTLDQEGFDRCMKIQKDTARGARKTTNYMGEEQTAYQTIDAALTTEFVGYDVLSAGGKATAMVKETVEDGQVLQQSRDARLSIYPYYKYSLSHMTDFNVGLDYLLSINTAGMCQYLFLNFATDFGALGKFKGPDYVSQYEYEGKPITDFFFVNVSFGYGFGLHLSRYVELMPYLAIGMDNVSSSQLDKKYKDNEEMKKSMFAKSTGWFGDAGLRFNILPYPFQIFGIVDYSFLFLKGEVYNNVNNPLGARQHKSGLNFGGGIRYCF